MKLLLASILTAITIQAETHNYKVVEFFGKTITDVRLVLDKDNHTFSIWYQGVKLNDEFMIASCTKPQRFCIYRKRNQFYGEIR